MGTLAMKTAKDTARLVMSEMLLLEPMPKAAAKPMLSAEREMPEP